MKKIVIATLLALILFSWGCYHATIDTGLEPGSQVIEQPFASGWIYGLVPPQTIETAERCPNGVARVETQISFVNYLVTAITFGIYTPMHIKVTCASSVALDRADFMPDIFIRENASTEEVQLAFDNAAMQSKEFGKPIYVAFR